MFRAHDVVVEHPKGGQSPTTRRCAKCVSKCFLCLLFLLLECYLFRVCRTYETLKINVNLGFFDFSFVGHNWKTDNDIAQSRDAGINRETWRNEHVDDIIIVSAERHTRMSHNILRFATTMTTTMSNWSQNHVGVASPSLNARGRMNGIVWTRRRSALKVLDRARANERAALGEEWTTTTTSKTRRRRRRRARAMMVLSAMLDENAFAKKRSKTEESDGGDQHQNMLRNTNTKKRKKRRNNKENALQKFFDVDSNIITTEGEGDDQEDEFEKTQLEIWGQVTQCLGKVLFFTFGVPYFASCSLQAMFVNPWLELKVSTHSKSGSSSPSLTMSQTESVCNEIARFEKRLYYENLAHFPNEQDPSKFEKTKRKLIAEEMKRLEIQERTRSTKALGNWIGSMIYVSILVCVLVYQKEFMSKMLNELSAQFNGLDSATQAFVLMLGADMVVGYHSSDGWQAFLAFVITRYGGDYRKFETFARMFVATVPVFLDVCFKYWVFNKLRKMSPSTQIILSEIERH